MYTPCACEIKVFDKWWLSIFTLYNCIQMRPTPFRIANRLGLYSPYRLLNNCPLDRIVHISIRKH